MPATRLSMNNNPTEIILSSRPTDQELTRMAMRLSTRITKNEQMINLINKRIDFNNLSKIVKITSHMILKWEKLRERDPK